jgi:hypothetical protein
MVQGDVGKAQTLGIDSIFLFFGKLHLIVGDNNPYLFKQI